MKPRLRIDFCGLWEGFNKVDNWFHRALSERFTVELTDQPEILFFSDGTSQAWRLHVCTRVYFSVERHLPDWSLCDYALTCHELPDSRNLRLPYYVVESEPDLLVKDDGWADRILSEPRKFCGFLISNPRAKRGARRVAFASRLMERAPVDSGGRWANNIGGPLRGGFPAKRAWLRGYRFNVCFENESLAGYTTEKITDAMMAGCIPVYWGNPEIARDFNPGSFLNLADHPTEDVLIDRMLAMSGDESAQRALLSQPWFPDNRPNACYSRDRFNDFIERVVSTPITPVGRRRTWLHPGRWTLVKRNRPPPAPW